jgi:hypothetical protein
MPTRLSEAIGVTHKALITEGAFDSFIDVDSLLYIDPHLLASSSAKELSGSAERFKKYFNAVLKLLKVSKTRGDLAWKQATTRLTFRELPYIALGYTESGTRGRAIGPRLAAELTGLAKQIVDAGIEDPDMFTLLGLLQDGVGPDLISDMTAEIILPDLLEFTARVAKKLKLRSQPLLVPGGPYDVPVTRDGQWVILVPADILRSLPVAHSWSDVDTVASHNAALRAKVNQQIGDTWRQATNRIKKKELKDAILRHPDLMRDLIDQYRAKKAKGYDFSSDPEGIQVWFEVAEDLAGSTPLDLTPFRVLSPDKLLVLVRTLCARFRELVENNRLSRVLYNDDGSRRREKAAQLFFFALASFYCEANNLDVSPESDAGAGPVDFKVSVGHQANVTVEVKLTSNPNLVHGFQEQLPAYNRAERTSHGILLVIRNGEHKKKLKDLDVALVESKKRGETVPEVVIVDGRPRPAASKRRR